MTDALLSPDGCLVQSSPVDNIGQLIALSGPTVRAMYGETYDDLGLPVDSLKYYSWLVIMTERLAAANVQVDAEVVIADAAVEVNLGSHWDAAKIKGLAALQRSRVEAFFDLCNNRGPRPKTTLMSTIVATDDYRRRRHQAATLLDESAEFKATVVQSVRADHREKEEIAGYAYSLDEVALISAFNLKVGPPREQFYDAAAAQLNLHDDRQSLVSILLRPSYPLQTSPGEFVRNAELREFGVTAYKAGSLGLGKRRLVIGRDSSTRARELLTATKLIRRAGAPNAVTELASVLQLVEWATCGIEPEEWLATRWTIEGLPDHQLCEEVVSLYSRVIDRVVAPALSVAGR